MCALDVREIVLCHYYISSQITLTSLRFSEMAIGILGGGFLWSEKFFTHRWHTRRVAYSCAVSGALMVMLHDKAFAGHGALFSFDVAAVGPYPLFCFIVLRLKAFWSQHLWVIWCCGCYAAGSAGYRAFFKGPCSLTLFYTAFELNDREDYKS